MLLTGRIAAFALLPGIYFLLDWLHWDLGGRTLALGILAVLALSAWTTRNGYETRVGKSLVLLTSALFFAEFGLLAFLRDSFGVEPDSNMVIEALFGTDQLEAGEFIEQYARSLALHASLILLAFAAFSWLVWRKPASTPGADGPLKRPRARKLALILGTLFILLHFIPAVRMQNPLLYFPIRYAKWIQQVRLAEVMRTEMDSASSDPGLASLRYTDDKPRTVVFIIGESITRADLPMAGYPRNTTPELNSMGDELIWFQDVVSGAPSTTPSMQKMLTPATLAEPNLWLTKPDLMIMAKKAGYKTFWLSNHTTDAEGEVAVFVSHADESTLANKGASRGEGSYDEIVLPFLENALRDPAPRKFIILHLLQAHPAYYYRYPQSFARFNDADDAVTKELKAEGRWFWVIRMRNYYDNAVLYTDHVLKRTLDLSRASGQRLAWIFVSDHGQDVGHTKNFAGYNVRARSQWEIPMIFWRSPSFPAPAVDVAALRVRPYQTDVLDDTVLGLLGISGDYYDPRSDIFSEQFEKVPRTIDGTPYDATPYAGTPYAGTTHNGIPYH